MECFHGRLQLFRSLIVPTIDLPFVFSVSGGAVLNGTVDGRNPKQPPGMVIKPCK